MGTVHLKCAGAQVLYYEPDGLLLSASLLPVDDWHGQHLLTFQLSYLGTGDLPVRIATEEATGAEPVRGGTVGSRFTPAVLRGGSRQQPAPDAWLTSLPVPDTLIDVRFTLRSDCCAENDGGPCGQLTARVAGYVPLLSVMVRAGAASASSQAYALATHRPVLSRIA